MPCSVSGPSVSAIRVIATFELRANAVARSIAPRLFLSSMTLIPTFTMPGEVSMMLSLLNFPDAKAAATTKGLIVEPGSTRSVTARFL